MLNADSENDYLKTIASQEGYCSDDLLKAQQVKMYVAIIAAIIQNHPFYCQIMLC
jgi:formyltetrahydrofolate hydrolase